MTDWRAVSAGANTTEMELVRLRAVTGDTMRGIARVRSALPYWVTLKATSIEAALWTSHRAGVAAFQAWFPLLGRTAPPAMPDEALTLELRLGLAAVSLAGLDRAAADRDAVSSLRQTLTAGDPVRLRALAARRRHGGRGAHRRHIEPHPPNDAARRRLSPRRRVQRDPGRALLRRFLVVADYGAAAPGAAPPLRNLAFLDLAAFEPSSRVARRGLCRRSAHPRPLVRERVAIAVEPDRRALKE